MLESRKIIELPKSPHGWTQLSVREMEEVNRLMLYKQQMKVTTEDGVADMDFKLKCFLLFSGLKVIHRTELSKDKEAVYLFRRRGLRYLFERIPMRSWQITQWIEQYLGWLDDPLKLIVCPYRFITIRGKRFKAPSALMTDVTRLQYFSAQNILTKYWDAMKMAEKLLSGNGTSEMVKAQLRLAEKYKCRFLACLFTPESIEVEVRTDTSVRKVNRPTWVYETSQVDENERIFRRDADRLFPVMNQFFQSIQVYYSNIFPDLFTTKKTSDGKDYLQMEVDTMNAVMKYAGFKNYQDINSSNAIFILGVLNNMSREAKEIKEMNKKLKRK